MKQIRLNAFAMNAPVHQSPGLWRHPRDRSTEFNKIGLWLDLAKLWERGLFDGVFLADVLGPYDVYGGNARAALAQAAQLPANDPLLLIPAMAAVTQNLGFGVTVSLSYENPYQLARRFSTLDHLTGGRVGWNIVTSYLDSAARAMGADRQRAHDDRYAVAEDFMTATYKLWEASWEEGAVLADKTRGIYADPDRVHVVRHESPYVQMEALHLVSPSPQRTPVLYQAGSSPAGLAFAARHAECVFVSGPSAAVIRPRVARLRQALVAAGRAPDSVKVFALATAITAPTEAEAHDKLADYRSYVDPVGALVLMGGWLGVDFSVYELDQKIRYIDNDAGRAAMENFTRADPNRDWTVREAAAHVAIGGAGPVFVGSAAQVAESMADWAAETDIDGFNLSYAVLPESFTDAVELLVPEWQARGIYKTSYAEGTLRTKLFGEGPLLSAPHPAAGFRMSQSGR
ncbi:LLM class flavin-dependent oxidoreductase [Acidisoma cellulosilytica]|uniref:LLM class flavin-dependent oxidoreductase n=1 Tax=Acidisoma cellulosilyticum TaxID=2802395 RepID=A0A963Z4Q7_9PROT|nr:LLM class flavin-dependent oxidoreductase [Acidisoma cellulosilyticum]MCB8882486.1 LLM class flavin-dependent oxidoreductase [Acidisoma cellulosilyticum]